MNSVEELAGELGAPIEALGLHSSYTEDDWVRWGTVNGQTRATNMRGSEFRFAVGLAELLLGEPEASPVAAATQMSARAASGSVASMVRSCSV